MSRLRKEGIIDSGRRWTAILDRPRLEQIAAGAPVGNRGGPPGPTRRVTARRRAP